MYSKVGIQLEIKIRSQLAQITFHHHNRGCLTKHYIDGRSRNHHNNTWGSQCRLDASRKLLVEPTPKLNQERLYTLGVSLLLLLHLYDLKRSYKHTKLQLNNKLALGLLPTV
jgi:hypothetical protein